MKSLWNAIPCVFLIMMLLLMSAPASMAAGCDVLVVMGFQEGFFRTEEIREGLEDTLQGICNLRYVYLNALSDPTNIEARAQEAYAAFLEMQPDGVIAVRDEAQTFFVLPYLKGKVNIPIIFCDINEPPETFGYPTDHITGIQGHLLIDRTILFVQQIVPDIRTIGTLLAKEAAAEALVKQIRAESDTYAAKILEPSYVTTYAEAMAMVESLKDQCDALLIGPIGLLLVDPNGNPVTMQTFVTEVAQKFGKPTMSLWNIVVHSGALCAVCDVGQEYGQVAGEMLQQALQGTPVSDIPITQNQFGQRFLNKTALKTLSITPSRQILVGAELVDTIK